MKRNILILLLLLQAGLTAHAQNEADVLRYSGSYYYGTARFNGLGGAFGALGGDMTSLNTNPGGVGVFRNSVLSFTPALELNRLNTEIDNSAFEDFKPKLVINNVGIIFNVVPKDPEWKAINWGFSYSRLNSFNDDLRLETTVPYSASALRNFQDIANGYTADELYNSQPFGAALIYDAYVLDPVDTSAGNTAYIPSGNYSGDIAQVHTVNRNGRNGESSLSIGANYNDKLYIGATLAFQNVIYNEETATIERILDKGSTELEEYTYSNFLETAGWGVNGKFGAIFRANPWLRIGAAVHTPTLLQMTDVYSSSVKSYFDDGTSVTPRAAEGTYDYRLRTPWRYQFSSAVLFGNRGLLSLQYEFSDLSTGMLKTVNRSSASTDAVFGSANEVVSRFFAVQNVFRVGAEYRLNKYFTARAGGAYFTSPYTDDAFTLDFGRRYQVGGGLGFRTRKFYVDGTYQYTTYDEGYRINTGGPQGIITNNLGTVSLTLGFVM